jgi:hypothetical protein
MVRRQSGHRSGTESSRHNRYQSGHVKSIGQVEFHIACNSARTIVLKDLRFLPVCPSPEERQPIRHCSKRQART